MNRIVRIVLFVAILFSAWGCGKNGQIDNEQLVKIAPTITKVTETDFQSGDAIGLTIEKGDEVYVTNEKLTYDGSCFSGSLNWYNDKNASATLKAYYPYQETAPTAFTVNDDQTAGVSSSDFVSSIVPGVLPTADAVQMVFSHRMSRLSIVVTNNSDYTLNGVTIKGAIPTAIIGADLTATVDPNASSADIKAYKSADGLYYAIIPPQKVALTACAHMNNKDLSTTLTEAQIDAGKEYRISITVENEAIQVTLSCELENWTNGGELSAPPTPPTTNTIYYGFGSSAQDVYDNALDENNPNAVSAKYRTTTSNSPAGSYTVTNSTGDWSYKYFLVPSNMNDPISFKLDDGIGDFFSDIAMVNGHNATIDITLPASYPYEEAIQTLGGQSYKVWKSSGENKNGYIFPFIVQ